MANQVATYKGKKYKCLWVGETKFGRRAHLAFFSGDKDFWVGADLCQISESKFEASYTSRLDSAPGGKTCSYCGARDCPRAWDPRELCQED